MSAPELRPHLAGLLEGELLDLLRTRVPDASPTEARKVIADHFEPRRADQRPRAVRRVVRAAAAALTVSPPLTLIEKAEDPADGFVKYLLQSPDGARFEAVRIPLQKPGRHTVCLSSQVGCALGCVFCATGRLGLRRQLAAWEMVESLRLIRADTAGQVTGAVFMGQGEPLANYDAVLRAAGVLCAPFAGRIAASAISISTAGLVPQIRRFAREAHPYRLVVSLTSAIQARRAELMPIARRYPLPELAEALRELHRATGVRQTVAWVVIAGVNTGQDEVDALGSLLGDLPLRLNLIDVNDPRPDGFQRADSAELAAFRDRLSALRQPIVRRYSGGRSRHAACGMLVGLRCGPLAADGDGPSS